MIIVCVCRVDRKDGYSKHWAMGNGHWGLCSSLVPIKKPHYCTQIIKEKQGNCRIKGGGSNH